MPKKRKRISKNKDIQNLDSCNPDENNDFKNHNIIDHDHRDLVTTCQNEKYWNQRYRLFSKFDQGIQLDNEGWFSVTPELIAKHMATKICSSICYFPKENFEAEKKNKPALFLDGFCGPGGNLIQLAIQSPESSIIFACDIDPKKILMAKNNCQVYSISHKIEFIIGDYFVLAPKFRVDAVLLSPPWGGPSYIDQSLYNIDSLKPKPGSVLIPWTKKNVCKNFALLLPRNINVDQLVDLLDPEESIEIESNYINEKVKTISAYYGQLIQKEV